MRAGLNTSKLYDEEIEYKSILGYQVGVEVDVNLIRSLSVNTGIYYIRKGHRYEIEFGPSDERQYEYKPVYIEIPIVLSYRIRLSDSSQFQLNGGCYYAYGLNSSDEVFFRDFKKEDVGLVLGAAVSYSHYVFSANYERSLIDIGQRNVHEHNSSIIITLGYNF